MFSPEALPCSTVLQKKPKSCKMSEIIQIPGLACMHIYHLYGYIS